MQKMTFCDYMQQLPERQYPRRQVMEKIAEATGKDVGTVRRWSIGEVVPAMLERKAISGVLNMPVEDLFPGVK